MEQNKIRLLLFPIFVLVVFFTFLSIQVIVFGKNCHEETKQTWRGEVVQKGLVIMVEFPDVKHDVNRNFVQKRFSQHLNNYVKEMSYHIVSLEIDVTERWYKMPNSVNRYKISSRNLEVDKSRVRKLIDDALDAADKEVDFAHYSFVANFMGAKLTFTLKLALLVIMLFT